MGKILGERALVDTFTYCGNEVSVVKAIALQEQKPQDSIEFGGRTITIHHTTRKERIRLGCCPLLK
jgi:hypothetical protein